MTEENSRAGVDERRSWSFEITPGGWVWKAVHPDGALERSSREFALLKDCTADAQAHGYVAWKTEDERRRDLALEVSKVFRRE